MVVLGGSKVSDKLGVIDHLLPTVDKLLVGGGMVFTFLAAQGFKVGSSLLEQDQIDKCKEYLERAATLGIEVVLPTDIVVASKFGADADVEITAAHEIEQTAFGASGLGLDIGPESAERFAAEIKLKSVRPSSGTDLWASSKLTSVRMAPEPWRRL